MGVDSFNGISRRSLRSTDRCAPPIRSPCATSRPVFRIGGCRDSTWARAPVATPNSWDCTSRVVHPFSLSTPATRCFASCAGTRLPGVGAAVCCEAERLPIRDRSVDFVTTFNAVHHFDLDRFVDEAARVLTADGHLFVYTRTPEQNAQSIWGQAFPGFASRETRLFDTATLRRALSPLGTVDIRSFDFARLETPATLAERVRSCAYSTFALYDRDELEVALEEFLESVPSHAVRWQDQNLLVHARRGG